MSAMSDVLEGAVLETPSSGLSDRELSAKQWLQGLADLEKVGVDAGGLWLPIGPAPIRVDANMGGMGTGPCSGIVLDIAIHPDDARIIFIATHGGVWKSTDGGATWSATMQSLPSLSSTALAIDAGNHDVIFAGTGVLTTPVALHAGLYKSLDRGLTWCAVDGGIHASVLIGKRITRIVSNAADSLLVGTSDGLYRSVDGGGNFGNNAPNFDNGQQS